MTTTLLPDCIQSCFFDFDGTLCASEPDIKDAWHDVFKVLDIRVPNFERLFRTGPSLHEMTEILFPHTEAAFRAHVISTFMRVYDASDFSHTMPYPGVDPWLGHLSAEGRKLYVVTNKRTTPTHSLIHKLGWDGLFAGLFSSDVFSGRSLPKKDLLRYALETVKAHPAAAAMIGDTVADIEAGRANGTMTVAVSWGYGPVSELRGGQPNLLLEAGDIL